MNYLLDTNICIAIIKGNNVVIERLRREVQSGSQILVSSVAAFELFYGIANSRQKDANDRSVTGLLSGRLSLIDFELGDARVAGQIRAKLERTGTLIGPYDLLMAGQALNRNLVLVTANEREFARVQGLTWENWAK
jgi:tRNA(fMet)-specific endonuclease VapC